MNLKSWLMNKFAVAPAAPQSSHKQGKPRDLPQVIGRHLVVEKGLDPDWVWNLKYVRKSREDSKGVYDIRVFNPLDAARNNLKIKDFDSFDDHMDLVLISGRYDKNDEKATLDYKHIETS